MKSLIALWKQLALELAGWCCTSSSQDCKTVLRRSEHEGLSFLTIVLPSFGKDFQKSLEEGQVGPTAFLGFKKRGGLPLFLGGFLDRVFDRASGRLLDDPCIDSIFSIRQLCFLVEKIAIPCTKVREAAAMRSFVECEKEIRNSDSKLSASDRADFLRIRQLLFSSILSEVEYDVYNLALWPKHGPGATADKLAGNGKYIGMAWTQRLESAFPREMYLVPSPKLSEELRDSDLLEPGAEIPVKVISVPKTQRTPRIIAIEPAAMQYCQQAVALTLVPRLERNNKTPGMLGFSDQTINQKMAKLGSENGSLATLDLSEASDRVSNQHVRLLLTDFPWLSQAVDSCRSRKADVQGHGVQRLAKFASMGSALTFPIEAMVFLTLVMIGIEKELSRPLTAKDVKSLRGQVRVYGDDIIVPVDYVHSVMRTLDAFGYLVNRNKSFWNGKFRESCGEDYYDGTRVTVTRVRQTFPHSRKCVEQTISLVSLRNQLYEQGLWQTTRYLDQVIRNLLRYFPSVHPDSSVLGRVCSLGYETQRMHPTLHAPLVKGWVASAKLPQSHIDGYAALMKCFLHKGEMPIADEKHLERAGRPRSLDIKLRWASPF